MIFTASVIIKRKLSVGAVIPKVQVTALLSTENCPIVDEIDGGNASTIYIASKGNIDSGEA